MGYPSVSKKQGHDFNFFQKITVSSSTFGGSDSDGYNASTGEYGPDVILTFPTQGIMFLNEDSTSVVEVSFNGTTVHDELNPTLPSKGVAYDNRSVSLIWLRLKSGSSAVVSIRAWGTR